MTDKSTKWTHRKVEAPRLRILLDPSTQERFDAKVQVMPNGCHMWTGGGDRYGNFTYRVDGAKLNIGAHVYAFVRKHGRFPRKGMVLRHSCDCGKCVNDAHLIEGTQLENIRDKLDKGRHPARYATRALSDQRVLAIRATLNDDNGLSTYKIAAMHGVSRSTVNHIKHGTRYSDV